VTAPAVTRNDQLSTDHVIRTAIYPRDGDASRRSEIASFVSGGQHSIVAVRDIGRDATRCIARRSVLFAPVEVRRLATLAASAHDRWRYQPRCRVERDFFSGGWCAETCGVTGSNVALLALLKRREPSAVIGLFSSSQPAWMSDAVFEHHVVGVAETCGADVVHVHARSITQCIRRSTSRPRQDRSRQRRR